MPSNQFQQGNRRAGKLTGEQVVEIRERYANERGCTQGQLCREYGVSIGTIANIVNGLTWRSLLHGAEPHVNRPPVHVPYQPPSDEEIAASMARFQERLAQAEPEPERFVYQRKPPSLYSDPPPLADGEPTGAGLDKLAQTARQPRVEAGLDDLMTDDDSQPKETDHGT